jgi:hypothetical protein
VPSVLKVVKRANDYSIPYGLMETLNYSDLQSMIIEYDIEALEQMKKDKERDRLDKLGIDRRKATAEDWNKL